MTTVLVPLDGSALAERALVHAVSIARRVGGCLRLVHACPAVSAALLESGAAVRVAAAAHAVDLHDARTAMERKVAALRADGVGVNGVVRSGDAAEVILAAAEDVDLVVMSTHGRGGLGRTLYGSVADEVLRRAGVPVLLIPARAAPTSLSVWPRGVLVGLDGSELAEACLAPAVALARMSGAEVALLRVVDLPSDRGQVAFAKAERARARRYLQRLVHRLHAPGVRFTLHVRLGRVVPTILDTASVRACDVVAVGTHGRSGFSRVVMGSVTTGLVEHATLPLLVVSATAAGPNRRAA